jgi:hypothetical protein
MLLDVKILATSTGWSTSSGYAINSGHADTADHATTSDDTTSATTAAYATSSGYAISTRNADTVDGKHASEFEPTLIKGNLGAGSNKITIGGTSTGAVIGAGVTIDVNESNIVHQNISGAGTYNHASIDGFINSKGQNNGLAELDSTGKVPLSEIPDTLIGALQYKGTWNCSTGLYPIITSTGDYYVCSVAGTISGTDYAVGDWLVYNGATWDRIDGGVHPHAVTHTSGAGDEIDGDRLDVDFSPSYYIPTSTGLSVLGELTSHLNGIDLGLNTKEPTLVKGNMTASLPIMLDQARQVIGGSVVVSHSTSTGYIHLPIGGSSNQILKNSGASGTGSWGTVTENGGALAAITTIGMSGQLNNTVSPGTPPFVVSSNTAVLLLNADFWDGYHYSDLFPVQETYMFLNDVTTWDATDLRHGFLRRLSGNAGQYLNGAGNFSTPTAAMSSAYSTTSFDNQTVINIVHNFGAFPVTQCLTSTGAVIVPESIVNNTIYDVTITFTAPETGNIILSVGSPQPMAIVSIATNYTVKYTDRIVEVTASGKTITLPTKVGHDRIYHR